MVGYVVRRTWRGGAMTLVSLRKQEHSSGKAEITLATAYGITWLLWQCCYLSLYTNITVVKLMKS